jgi:hypothetical protein
MVSPSLRRPCGRRNCAVDKIVERGPPSASWRVRWCRAGAARSGVETSCGADPGTSSPVAGTNVTNPLGRVEDAARTCDDAGVPLSEDEQRILRQIEQELSSDPSFSQRGYRVSRRRLVVLSLALIVGLVLTVAGLTVSFVLAFAAFVGVLVVAVMLEGEIRVLGREKIGNLPINAWLASGNRQRRPE